MQDSDTDVLARWCSHRGMVLADSAAGLAVRSPRGDRAWIAPDQGAGLRLVAARGHTLASASALAPLLDALDAGLAGGEFSPGPGRSRPG